MTNYTKGRTFEYQVKAHYERLGYYVVRSAGSHSEIDLVAFPEHGRPLAIQCKRYSRGVPPVPSVAFVGLNIEADLVWITKKRGQRNFDVLRVN